MNTVMKKSISFCLKITAASFIALALLLFMSSQRVSSHVNPNIDQVMFIVGSNGTIIKTTLSETDWHRQARVTGNSLLSGSFIDGNIGWLVGSKGTILHTTNGGLNWSKQISGNSADLKSVDFVNDKNGWAVGGLVDGTILTTRNGGADWELQTTLPELLNAVHFTDEYTGWVVGASGSIYHTSNSG